MSRWSSPSKWLPLLREWAGALWRAVMILVALGFFWGAVRCVLQKVPDPNQSKKQADFAIALNREGGIPPRVLTYRYETTDSKVRPESDCPPNPLGGGQLAVARASQSCSKASASTPDAESDGSIWNCSVAFTPATRQLVVELKPFNRWWLCGFLCLAIGVMCSFEAFRRGHRPEDSLAEIHKVLCNQKDLLDPALAEPFLQNLDRLATVSGEIFVGIRKLEQAIRKHGSDTR